MQRNLLKVDFIWLPDEPASCTHFAAGELQRLGILGQGIASTPENADATIEYCRRTDADFILFFSGNAQLHWLFDTPAKRAALKSVRTPRVCWATEQSVGSPFPNYKAWAEERMDCFTHYLAASAQDVPFYSAHAPCSWCPMWASHDVFKPSYSWNERVKRTCFIGLIKDYYPGIFEARRQLLARLKNEGLVDHLHIPRHVATAYAVAAVYAAYAATIQLPTSGFAYGIRAFEATAAGALLIFARGEGAQIEPDLFPNGESSLHYDPSDPDELITLLRYMDWNRAEQIATSGHEKFKLLYSVEPTIRRIANWVSGGAPIQDQLNVKLAS